MSSQESHVGQCFCGAVELSVQGAPAGMGYCHCSACRQWSAGPVNAFSLWTPAQVTVTRGKEHLGRFARSENSVRTFCTRCGGHLLTDHPLWKLVDVYAAVLPTLEFAPGVHVNYASTVLPMRDGLPKMKDFPKELGGSGEAVPE